MDTDQLLEMIQDATPLACCDAAQQSELPLVTDWHPIDAMT